MIRLKVMPTKIRLEVIDVPVPCDADWAAMRTVEEAVRHCELCRLNVFDLSEMSRDDAEELVARHVDSGERLCVRLCRRADGTVVTADCAKVRRALAKTGRRVGWLSVLALAAMVSSGCYATSPFHRPDLADRVRAALRLDDLIAWLDPQKPLPNLFFGSQLRGAMMPGMMVLPPIQGEAAPSPAGGVTCDDSPASAGASD